MTTHDRRLRSAIRMTPREERARYAEEWERDLADADGLGVSAPGMVRGAMGVALRRRARWAGHALLGDRDDCTAVLLWLGLVVLMALAFLGGGPFGVVVAVGFVLAVVALTFAGRPSVLTHRLLAGSAVVGVSAAAYVWWVLGVQIDASDSATAAPAAAAHGGLGLVILGLSIVVFMTSGVVGYARHPH